MRKIWERVKEIAGLPFYLVGELFDMAHRAVMYRLNGGFILKAVSKEEAVIRDASSAAIVKGRMIVPAKINGYRITGIDGGAFDRRSELKEVILPDGIRTIGIRAFAGCRNLKRIVLSDTIREIDVQAFEECSGLETISLPKSLERLGEYAFYGCARLREIMIPPKIRSIGEWTFSRCGRLRRVVLPRGLTAIGERAFSVCLSLRFIKLPPNLRKIGNGAFFACGQLRQIDLPDSVTEIGEEAFKECGELEKVTVPPMVGIIRKMTFAKCRKLTKVGLHDGVRCIEERAFEECSALRAVQLPEGLTELGMDAFGACRMDELTIPASARIRRRENERCSGRWTYAPEKLTVTAAQLCEIAKEWRMGKCRVLCCRIPIGEFSAEFRPAAAAGFAADRENYPAEMHEGYTEYIRKNVSVLLDAAIEYGELMHLMCREHMIPLSDVDVLIRAVRERGKTEMIPMLLEYKNELREQSGCDAEKDGDDLSADDFPAEDM